MRILIFISALNLCGSVFHGCTPGDSGNGKEPAAPMSNLTGILPVDTIVFSRVEKKSGRYQWMYEWNKFVSDEILRNKKVFLDSDSIYERDWERLCPGYSKASDKQKVALWTLLIASIAKYESNFDPSTRFKEPPPLNVYSEGLLQLSYGDETRYKNVPLDSEKQNIMIPEVNLRTGVIIFARQLERRRSIFTDRHFYWSVLTNKQNEIIDFFRVNVDELSVCQ